MNGIDKQDSAGSRRDRSHRGMTAVEMLVSTSILVAMMLAFATVLMESRRTVSGAQRTMRANAAAAAVAQVVRNDVRQASKRGFFCINGPGQLLFTTAGTAWSLTGGATVRPAGSGTITMYGLCTAARPNPPGGNWPFAILWRSQLVLNSTATGATTDLDCYNAELHTIQKEDRTAVNTRVTGLLGNAAYAPTSLTTPPLSIANVRNLWRYLAENVATGSMSIAWTDGTVGATGLNWYGSARASGNALIDSGSGASYRALWTSQAPNLWPVAVRITFTLTFPRDDAPSEYRYAGTPTVNVPYEVVCAVGQ